MVATIILGSVITILLILDVRYIYKENKKGVCIGCSEAGKGHCHGECSTGKNMTNEEIKAAADRFMAMKKAEEAKRDLQRM
ncbi:MAG: FeoB-associated Cys-rich membrane protein [Lachnospiraceae bacterium]|nr:FeoB-associated Cys-rich membrane protein [Lachnospiraceae bacterium]